MKEWDEIDEMFSKSFGNDEVMPPKGVKRRIDEELFGGTSKLPWYKRNFLLWIIPLLFITIGTIWILSKEEHRIEKQEGEPIAQLNETEKDNSSESETVSREEAKNDTYQNRDGEQINNDMNGVDQNTDFQEQVHKSNKASEKNVFDKKYTPEQVSAKAKSDDEEESEFIQTKMSEHKNVQDLEEKNDLGNGVGLVAKDNELAELTDEKERDAGQSVDSALAINDSGNEQFQSETGDSVLTIVTETAAEELLIDPNEKKHAWSIYTDGGFSMWTGNRKGAQLNDGSTLAGWQSNPGLNIGAGTRLTFNNKFGVSAGLELSKSNLEFTRTTSTMTVSIVGYDSTYNQIDSTWTVTPMYDTTATTSDFSSLQKVTRYRLPLMFTFSTNRGTRNQSTGTGFFTKLHADFGIGALFSYNKAVMLTSDSLGFLPANKSFGLDAVAQWGVYYPIGKILIGLNMQGLLPIINTLDFNQYGIKPKSFSADFRLRIMYQF